MKRVGQFYVVASYVNACMHCAWRCGFFTISLPFDRRPPLCFNHITGALLPELFVNHYVITYSFCEGRGGCDLISLEFTCFIKCKSEPKRFLAAEEPQQFRGFCKTKRNWPDAFWLPFYCFINSFLWVWMIHILGGLWDDAVIW